MKKFVVSEAKWRDHLRPCEYEDHLSVASEHRCMEEIPYGDYGSWLCTRPRGHSGLHEAIVEYPGYQGPVGSCGARWDDAFKMALVRAGIRHKIERVTDEARYRIVRPFTDDEIMLLTLLRDTVPKRSRSAVIEICEVID